ncbi:hypothetical protein BU16DRAFT_93875 [Lophium mytilinum]|uniref:Uncharacterized protein n=1 Tax=Lophium mytilinum TaxID=390894 RepID=A0A6A6QKZ8_9PEZI|nr:hypothetical protein BU16DRAFT_93875 [Lophium mytilinum]
MGIEEVKIPLLPATYRTPSHSVRLVSADLQSFLECELSVERLNAVHKWLWLAGLPSSPRPLHYQRLKKREIVVAEQLDLHMVWSPSRILIKPLSRFLFCPHFWHANICPHPLLYQTALGFLLSYIALIEREIDLKIAKDKCLIPESITWAGWLALVEEIITTISQGAAYPTGNAAIDILSTRALHTSVNPRFYYGELRLGRLNWIYRLIQRAPRGYLSSCTTYGEFVKENVNSLITIFAYTAIVLSAMQVGLATTFLSEDYAFGRASYVFSLFAIIAPLAGIVGLLAVLAVFFTMNLLRTLKVRGDRRQQGAGV